MHTYTTEEAKEKLYPICGSNLKLKNLIKKVLKKYDNEIHIEFGGKDVKWDVEDDEYDEIALNTGDGWFVEQMNPDFFKFFNNNGGFNFDNIRIVEDKFIFIYESFDDKLPVFHILNSDCMVDGVLAHMGIDGTDVDTIFYHHPYKFSEEIKCVNDSSETMRLGVTSDGNLYFYHNKYTTDFIKLGELVEVYEKFGSKINGFKYSLTDKERSIFSCFVQEHMENYGEFEGLCV